MSLPKLKTFRIPFEKALEACGEGESLIDTLYTLQDEGAIKQFEVVVEILVDRDKASAIEHYFLLRDYDETDRKNDTDLGDYDND
jgi:hypothetical protein